MPDALPYFPLYPKDMIGDENVQAMDTLAFGAYIKLLCFAWHAQPPATIPDDHSRLARLSGIADSDWPRVWSVIEPCWRNRNGRWEQKRLKEEHDKASDIRASRANGGYARWKKPSSAQAEHKEEHVLRAYGSGSSGVAVEDEGEGEETKPPSVQDQAAEVYAAYPLKVGKPAAIRAITRAIGKHGFDQVFKATKRYAELRAGDTSFMPHPSTWFNQERYNDDENTWRHDAAKPKPSRNDGTYNAKHVGDYGKAAI